MLLTEHQPFYGDVCVFDLSYVCIPLSANVRKIRSDNFGLETLKFVLDLGTGIA